MEERKRSEYRSSKRSRFLITGALVSLMESEEFESITVTDIVRKADINRGTFYSHYKSTYDVIRKAEAELVSEVLQLFKDCRVDERDTLLEKISELIESRKSFYESIFTADEGSAFRKYAEKGIYEFFMQNGIGKDEAFFISAGLAAVITEAVTGESDIRAAASILKKFF